MWSVVAVTFLGAPAVTSELHWIWEPNPSWSDVRRPMTPVFWILGSAVHFTLLVLPTAFLRCEIESRTDSSSARQRHGSVIRAYVTTLAAYHTAGLVLSFASSVQLSMWSRLSPAFSVGGSCLLVWLLAVWLRLLNQGARARFSEWQKFQRADDGFRYLDLTALSAMLAILGVIHAAFGASLITALQNLPKCRDAGFALESSEAMCRWPAQGLGAGFIIFVSGVVVGIVAHLQQRKQLLRSNPQAPEAGATPPPQ